MPTDFFALRAPEILKTFEIRPNRATFSCNEMIYGSFVQIAAGVPEFELLTNSAANNGNMFAAGAYLINKEKLLQTGVQILEYEGGCSSGSFVF